MSQFHSRLISIISIALVLFLLGLVFLIGLLGNKLSVYVKENISFSIVLKDNLRESDIKRMQKALDVLPYIKSTEYIYRKSASGLGPSLTLYRKSRLRKSWRRNWVKIPRHSWGLIPCWLP